MNQATKVIVITGVTRGLGRAMAEGFLALGHTVCGCGRSSNGIKKQSRYDFALVDVTREQEVKTWAGRVLGTFGPPDLLINNAAIINSTAPLCEVPAEEFDRVIDINIKGVANVIRHFAPPMIARKSGVIVNLSSGWGRSTSPEVAPYCATKYAIEGLTKAFAQELPDGMAAVPLNPGIIDTEMLRSSFGDSAGDYRAPKEWSEKAVPFLLRLGPGDNGKSLSAP
jgi:NAD(P)-dependent dehydrogenase (short-subunit alcohol dehydrogenase family)